MREMRVLGPYLPSDQGLGGEIARRVDAMQQAFRMCGNFWSSGTPQTLKKLIFQAFVTGAAWSGLTAFVLPARHTDILDAQLGKLLRERLRGT